MAHSFSWAAATCSLTCKIQVLREKWVALLLFLGRSDPIALTQHFERKGCDPACVSGVIDSLLVMMHSGVKRTSPVTGKLDEQLYYLCAN